MIRFLLSPYGRTSRGGYWAFIGGLIAITILAVILDAVLGLGDLESESGPFEITVSILSIWPSIAVAIRRFHDRNMTGWWYLILTIMMLVALIGGAFIGGLLSGVDFTALEGMSAVQMMSVFWPSVIGVLIVAIYWFVVQLVLPGTRGDNKYGPDPLAK